MIHIALHLARPEDVEDFDTLTQEHHQAMRPDQRSYATCGAAGYQRMSREGFLDTALQNVNFPSTMCAVAVRSTKSRTRRGPHLECLLLPVNDA